MNSNRRSDTIKHKQLNKAVSYIKVDRIFARTIIYVTVLYFSLIGIMACANPAAAHLKQGDAYLEDGNFDSAISEYMKAGESDPSIDVKVKIDQVNEKQMTSLLQAGDYDKSIAACLSALTASPSDSLREKLADAYVGRAWYYKSKRLNPYALKDLTSAVETAPKYFRAYYERGRFYNNQVQYGMAILDFNKALSLKPDFAAAYSERAFSYYKGQKWEQALADANKAIGLDPAEAQFYYTRSLIYRAMAKPDLAISDLETSIGLSKDAGLTDKASADLLLLQPK